MVINIPTIQPFTYQASTAFDERVQLANKVNEIIDGINSIGEIPDIQAQIDTINSTIAQIQADIANTDREVSTIQSQLNSLIQEVNGLLKEVISEITLDSPGYGQVRMKVIHEDETETASNALQIPVIQDGGITLISGTTDRSFKIQYITMDGVTHTTNDFVIPEGGGTDVTITSISILQGDTVNDIKFQVGLSDGSSIQSNSYPIPQAAITPATTSQIGGIKVGTNLSVTADGTLSVDMTTIGKAAKADSLMWTADASKVTLHVDSLNGSDFTDDVPQAAQGVAGTIDAASYQKITANESAISELKADVAALAPSVSVNESADPPTITVAVNGKSSTANLPAGGGNEWEEIDLSNIPTDFEDGDLILVCLSCFYTIVTSGTAPKINWNSALTEASISESTSTTAKISCAIVSIASTGNPAVIGFQVVENSAIGVTKYRPTYKGLINNPSRPIGYIECTIFNGASTYTKQVSVTRDNVSRYIYKMFRYKSR